MVTSVHFNNFFATGEQRLLEDLVIESVRVYGVDTYYVPRSLTNFGRVYGEDDQSVYDSAYMVEMYVKNIYGFTGDKDFVSKFAGLEIRDQVVFSIARRTFANEVGADAGLNRPREGDLVFFPLNGKCFQVKFVDAREMFYQLGALQTWELTCELFEYSSERLSTGIPEIDSLQVRFSNNLYDWALRTEDGAVLTTESGDVLVVDAYDEEVSDPFSDSQTIQTQAAGLLDWTEVDPFSEGRA